MSEKKKPDPLTMEIKATMGEGKEKTSLSGYVKDGVVHAELTFPSSRLPDLVKVIETIKFIKMPPLTTPPPTKKP